MPNPIRDFYLNHVDKLGVCTRLECADGFTMSVQASHFHCCQPQENLPTGDYSHWEVGFPSSFEPELALYGTPLTTHTETIFEYVPTDIINSIIAKHGGIKGAVKPTRRRPKKQQKKSV